MAAGYNNFWYDRGTKAVGTRRTSLIVDPPDGRIPALLPEAEKRAKEKREWMEEHATDGPEGRSLPERCILWTTAGPPMLPGPYNNNFQIVQTRDRVVILNEMIHNVRIIPLDGNPHLSGNIRQWSGDSRGHWDGNTLVVDTINFSDEYSFRGSDRQYAFDRTLHACFAGHAAVRIYDERSNGIYQAVDGADCRYQSQGAHLRVRLSRGELRDDGYSRRSAGSREEVREMMGNKA